MVASDWKLSNDVKQYIKLLSEDIGYYYDNIEMLRDELDKMRVLLSKTEDKIKIKNLEWLIDSTVNDIKRLHSKLNKNDNLINLAISTRQIVE